MTDGWNYPAFPDSSSCHGIEPFCGHEKAPPARQVLSLAQQLPCASGKAQERRKIIFRGMDAENIKMPETAFVGHFRHGAKTPRSCAGAGRCVVAIRRRGRGWPQKSRWGSWFAWFVLLWFPVGTEPSSSQDAVAFSAHATRYPPQSSLERQGVFPRAPPDGPIWHEDRHFPAKAA